MLTLLAVCPIRIRAFASLELNQTFAFENGHWWILLPPELTKSRRIDHRAVPDLLTELINDYINSWHPRLATNTTALWPATHGGAMSLNSISRTLTETTRQLIGKPLSPNMFRHCVAQSIAINEGASIHLASAVLRHTDPRTTEKNNASAMIKAAVTFGEIVRELD